MVTVCKVDRMGKRPNMPVIHNITIATMLNNNDGNDGHRLQNVACKQTFREL